jgi:hypothetical protein
MVAAFMRFTTSVAGMKHYFLFSVTIPDGQDPLMSQSWQGFLYNHPTHKKPAEGIQRLAENVWLIERTNGVSMLSSLVSSAEKFVLKASVRFLMEETENS